MLKEELNIQFVLSSGSLLDTRINLSRLTWKIALAALVKCFGIFDKTALTGFVATVGRKCHLFLS